MFVQLNEERVSARHLFLTLIEHRYPEVLESLAVDVLPHYQADDRFIDEALFNWATKFNLLNDRVIAQWVEFQASKTLEVWDQYPCMKGSWHTLVPPLMGRSAKEFARIEIEVRLADGPTLADVQKRAMAQFRKKLIAHVHAAGLKEREPLQMRHLEWAVRFQIGLEPVPAIAGTVNSTYRQRNGASDLIEEKTVRDGVRKVLGLLQLDRRFQRPGPTVKTSSKVPCLEQTSIDPED